MRVSPLTSSARHPLLSAGLALGSGAFALVMLAGCTPGTTAPTLMPTSSSSSGAAPGEGPSAGATEVPAPTPTPTPTLEPAGTPVGLGCEDILTADDIYAFNPNFGTAPDYEPAAGSAAETAVSYDGVACGWLNQSSGEIIEISVAQPNDMLMTDLKNKAVTQSKPVPTYGTPPDIEGYFTRSGASGQAQIFAGKYWVVAESDVFFEPGDAQRLLDTVVSHLP